MVYIPSNNLFDRIRRRAAVELFAKPFQLPLKTALITFSFDDCPHSACETGKQILEKHKALGTYYISAGFMDQEDHQGSCFSKADIECLHASGHEIACHSYAHLDTAKISIDGLSKDLSKNQKEMQHILGKGFSPQNFAYPFGNMTPLVKRNLRQRYATCRSVRTGVNRGMIDLACLKAVEINEINAPETCMKFVDDVVENGGWLIFFTHDVRENPSRYGCTPEHFENVVVKARRSGAQILSVRDSLKFLGVNAS